jgi:hypothetical protein
MTGTIPKKTKTKNFGKFSLKLEIKLKNTTENIHKKNELNRNSFYNDKVVNFRRREASDSKISSLIAPSKEKIDEATN